MISEERINEVLNFLEPQEWMGLLERDDEGILPPCCGNISHLRDVLSDLLVQRSTFALIEAGQALEAEGDQHFEQDVIDAFQSQVSDLLDEEEPGWRDIDLDAKRVAMDAWTLKLALAQTSEAPDAEPAPFSMWATAFHEVGHLLGQGPALDIHGEYRQACENLRLAGAPVKVVTGMWEEGIRVWRTR